MLGILGTTEGIGIYSATFKLISIGIMFSNSILMISAPIISDIYTREEGTHQLQLFIQTITRWSVLLNIPVFLTLVLFSESLLTIFGEEFTAGTTALSILAFGFLISAIAHSSGTAIKMTGYTRLSFVNSVIFVCINLALDLLLIPSWGVTGAALAVTLAIVVVNVLRLSEVYYLLRIIPFNVKFLKPITAGVLTLIITYLVITLLSTQDTIFQVIIGMFVLWSSYIIIVVLLKFSKEDLMVMKKVKTNLTSLRFYFKKVND
jgi:O-antigen/teichoic acid export membrane protein